MIISYWSCPFAECDDYYTEDDHIWLYMCTHSNNVDKYCDLENKWGNSKDNCVLLDTKESK